MHIWVTKYALTEGIQEYDNAEISSSSGSMVTVKLPGAQLLSSLQHFHGEGREWHRTRESAVAQANKMRVNKIASLKKSLAKVQNLEFK